MANTSVPVKLRLTQPYLDRVRAQAEAERRSVAMVLQIIVEQHYDQLDNPTTAAQTSPQAPVSPQAPTVGLHPPTDADRMLALIDATLASSGRDMADGRRVVSRKTVMAAWVTFRADEIDTTSSKTSFHRNMRLLRLKNAIEEDDGGIWRL
jgi:hypothetical protein